jgi:hypothetical protein
MHSHAKLSYSHPHEAQIRRQVTRRRASWRLSLWQYIEDKYQDCRQATLSKPTSVNVGSVATPRHPSDAAPCHVSPNLVTRQVMIVQRAIPQWEKAKPTHAIRSYIMLNNVNVITVKSSPRQVTKLLRSPNYAASIVVTPEILPSHRTSSISQSQVTRE